jgi:hypothetical protein
LIADELMVLGDTHAAGAWYHTARTAADTTNNRALQADVRTLAAIPPLYAARPDKTITLTRHATAIAADTPSITTALAPILEALGCAQRGDHHGATTALHQARQRFDHTAPWQQADSIFGFSQRRLHFYESRILLTLGHHTQAWAAQDNATALYPPEVPGDPTLIHLDRATSLATQGATTDACTLAEHTLLHLPDTHRTPLFIRAARRVWHTIPHKQRTHPTARHYNELLHTWEKQQAGTPASLG